MIKKGIFTIFIILSLLVNSNLSAQENRVIDSLLTCLKNTPIDTAKVEILTKLCEVYRKAKMPNEAEAFAMQALKISEKKGFKKGIVESKRILGIQAYFKKDYVKAIAIFENCIPLYSELNNQTGISDCYKKIGLSYAYQNEYSTAIIHYEEALKIDEKINDLYGISVCLNDLGVMYNYKGDHAKSIECQKRSLDACKKLGDNKAIATRLLNLGVSYDEQGDYDEAIKTYLEALEIKIEIGDSVGTSMCLNNLGEVYKHKGDYALAIEYYEKSLHIDTELDDQVGIAICLLNIGDVHFKQNNYGKALSYYEESNKIAEKLGNKRVIVNNLNHIGEVFIKQNRIDESIVKFQRAIDLSKVMGDRSEEAKTIFNMGEALLSQLKYKQAKDQFYTALFIHEELGEKSRIAADKVKIGLIWFELENIDKAIEYSLSGLQIAKETGSKENIKLAAETLSKAYANLNKYSEAYQYSILFKNTNDSIFTIESQKQIQLVENRFELERKKQEIDYQNIKLAKQEAEINQQQLKQNALLGGLIGIFVLVIVIVVGYIRIKRAKTLISRQMVFIEESNEELNQTNEELNVTIETNNQQKEIIEKKNKEITSSIHYAKYIQRAILPSHEKISDLLPNHFVMYHPRNIVSGDFYWIAEIEKRIIVAASDCTGHGVPGAFMSMLGISFLNDIVNKEYITHPGVILRRLRMEIVNALQQKGVVGEQRDGMDISLCSISFDNMELQFSGANAPIYIIRQKSLEPIQGADELAYNDLVLYEVKGDKMPVALYEKMDRFKTVELKIHKGDLIYLFSDGFADQFGGPENKRFMYKTFKQLLLLNSKLPMPQQKEALDRAFQLWKDDFEQIDDVLVWGIQV